MPGGLVEQDVDARAGGEPHVVQPEARCPGLDQHLVEVARIAQPDLGVVDPRVALEPKRALQRGADEVEARLGQRVADVVGRLDQADHSLGAEPADVQRAAGCRSPGLRERLLDQHLVAASRCRSRPATTA